MGNAACTIHHPTSLDHGIPYLESGKIAHTTNSMIRMEKKDGAAVGCGGTVTFKKTVLSSEWTFKCTKENTFGVTVGKEVTVSKATDKDSAEAKLAVQFSASSTEINESFVLIKSVVSDANDYSELYVYVDYNGKNNGRYEWRKNDLGLKANHHWLEDSEMVVDVTF